MLYAHPSTLTHADLGFHPDPIGPELPTSPAGLGLRGSVGLDVPCHAAVGSPYPLKTLFRPPHFGAKRNCCGEALLRPAPSLSSLGSIQRHAFRHPNETTIINKT